MFHCSKIEATHYLQGPFNGFTCSMCLMYLLRRKKHWTATVCWADMQCWNFEIEKDNPVNMFNLHKMLNVVIVWTFKYNQNVSQFIPQFLNCPLKIVLIWKILHSVLKRKFIGMNLEWADNDLQLTCNFFFLIIQFGLVPVCMMWWLW